jgi:hypothetical protein
MVLRECVGMVGPVVGRGEGVGEREKGRGREVEEWRGYF